MNIYNKRHAVIFGGTKGLGRATARLFAKEGSLVSAIGRTLPGKLLNDKSSNLRYFKAELRDQHDIIEVLKKIIATRGWPDSLIFCQRYRGQEDPWAGELDISLTATKTAIEFFSNNLTTRRDLSIVITSSIAGDFIVSEQPLSYHVGKSALNQLARYYAVTLGKKGIRVNAVSPGTILKEESRAYYLKNKPLYKLYRQITPAGRMITAEEIAAVIFFLCSPSASAINGQNITVDGGLSLRGQAALAKEIAGI